MTYQADPTAALLSSPAGFATLVDPAYKIPPHIALLNKHLVDLATGRTKRLIVQMPPRHGKSELCSKFMPAWFLGMWPDKKVILASYEHSFASFWGRQARDLLKEHGPAFFDQYPRKDVRAADDWQVQGHRGGMVTAGVGGPITGKGAHLFIIDDPVKNDKEALSKTKREGAKNWYRSTARTRLEPNASIMVIMTRWHKDDLAGWLIASAIDESLPKEEREPWVVLSLPAIAEDNDLLGRKRGEPLWPERYDTTELSVLRSSLGPYWWSALFQQRPTPEEGGVIKRSWLKYYRLQGAHGSDMGSGVVPLGLDGEPIATYPISGLYKYIVVDLAASQKEHADYTVVSVWGSAGDAVFLLDLVRERLGGPDTLSLVAQKHREWGASTIWVESHGFQLSYVQQLAAQGLPVRELLADKDKIARMYAASPYFEQGKVFLPKDAHWLPAYEDELLEFPKATHDDQADVTSYAIAYCDPFFSQTFGGAPIVTKKYKQYPTGMFINAPLN